MDEEEELKRIYFLECEEFLAGAETSLERLRAGEASESLINAVFRAVHSIKGGAGAFGLSRLATYAHAFESYLDLLRSGEADLDELALDLLFDGLDLLRLLVAEVETGEQVPEARHDQMLEALRAMAGIGAEDDGGAGQDIDIEAFGASPMEEDFASGAGELRRHVIALAPGPRMLAAGVDPLGVIRALKALGRAEVTVDTDALPGLRDLDAGICALSWIVTLDTPAERTEIDDILEMIDDLAETSVEGPPEPGTMSGPEAEPAPAPMAPSAPALPALARAAPPIRPVAPPAAPPVAAHVSSQAPKTATAKPVAAPEKQVPTVRVTVPKLERLGNMVGELIITQAFLSRQAADLSPDTHGQLFRALDEMAQHIRDLADTATSIRAQPLRAVFSRFGALIRDLEKTTGKSIRMEITGDATEIDKTVVERLSEPLTHLIRNSVDHGIESPERRRAAGKPEEGRLWLSAEQRGTQVVIELADDGAGIDRDRVLAKAIERGLVDADADLSDQEIDQLIFLPGFSTAEAVTSVSGRGVGMDAVRATIHEMGGRVALRSAQGEGTTFTLVLPLSLAVQDAMVAVVGGHTYLIPINDIVESLRPNAEMFVRIDRDRPMLSWRGELLRIVELWEVFDIPGAVTVATEGILVIAESGDGETLAILVDDLVGQEAFVVKSLERNYRKVPGVAAATILGDGRAALILDLSTLGEGVPRRGARAHRALQPERV